MTNGVLSPRNACFLDANIDGLMDVAVYSDSLDVIFLVAASNEQSQYLSPIVIGPVAHLSRLIALKIDDDEYIDLFVATWDYSGTSDLLWFKNPGSGSESWEQHLVLSDSDGILEHEVGDVNGDGFLDIVVSRLNGERNVQWFENLSGQGVFQYAGTICEDCNPGVLDLADVDSDGDLDIVTQYGTIYDRLYQQWLVWYSQRDQALEFGHPVMICQDCPWLLDVMTVNLDSNSSAEFLVTTWDPSWKVVLLRSSLGQLSYEKQNLIDLGSRSGFLWFSNGARLSETWVLDFNSDGYTDVISSATDVGTVFVAFQSSDGEFHSGEEVFHIAGNVSTISISDVDGDSDADILACLYEENQIVLFLNK